MRHGSCVTALENLGEIKRISPAFLKLIPRPWISPYNIDFFFALIGSFYKIGLSITHIGVGGYMHGQELKMGRG